MKGLVAPEKTVQPVIYLFDPNEAMGTTFEADDVSVIKVAILTRDRAYIVCILPHVVNNSSNQSPHRLLMIMKEDTYTST